MSPDERRAALAVIDAAMDQPAPTPELRAALAAFHAPAERRRRAVDLALTIGIRDAAGELGVSAITLRQWCRKACTSLARYHRARIADYLRTDPGATMRRVAVGVGITIPQARFRLQHLVRTGRVLCEQAGPGQSGRYHLVTHSVDEQTLTAHAQEQAA